MRVFEGTEIDVTREVVLTEDEDDTVPADLVDDGVVLIDTAGDVGGEGVGDGDGNGDGELDNGLSVMLDAELEEVGTIESDDESGMDVLGLDNKLEGVRLIDTVGDDGGDGDGELNNGLSVMLDAKLVEVEMIEFESGTDVLKLDNELEGVGLIDTTVDGDDDGDGELDNELSVMLEDELDKVFVVVSEELSLGTEAD